jgi:hypothetical protein
MGWLTDLINERKGKIQDAADAAEPAEEGQHEPGTRRGEKREPCYHIDPVTKQPMHPEGH